MKRVAVIGSNGYIGKHVAYYLRKSGHVVACYDIVGEDCIKVDLTKPQDVNKINFNVDVVFLFAGLTGTFVSFEKFTSYVNTNEMVLLNLLDAIKKSKYLPRVIFPSSRLVYKGVEHALKEDDEKETKTVYAVNKLACEGYLYAYANSFGIPYTIFRICVPFGNLLSNDYSFGTIGFMIRQATTKGEITLYGDGSLKRTFTSMRDLCRQMVDGSLSEQSINEIYNIGGVSHSLKEAAEVVANEYGATISFIDYPKRDLLIESGSTFFDASKIENLLGKLQYDDITTLFHGIL